MATDPFRSAIADFELLPIAATIAEVEGTVVAANAACGRLFGRPVSQLVGSKAWDFVPGSDHIWGDIVASARRADYHSDITIATPDGPRDMHYVAAIRIYEGREHVLLIAVPLGRSQDSEPQRTEALGLVAGGIAHDFNNQLVSVLAEASAASEDPRLDEALRDSLRRIEVAAQRMALSTKQLLAYAGRGRYVSELLDPDEVVSSMEEQLKRLVRTDAVLSVSVGCGVCLVQADRALLRDVIMNLVVNASESLAISGGKIHVSTTCKAQDGTTWWRLEVRDDGAGMDKHTSTRMYDPFFTTKTDRQGLGLSAVHGIVRRIGGDIGVDSEIGKGSRFRVRLPTLPKGHVAANAQRAATARSTSLSGLRILVADDEPSVRSTIRRLLERRGATVITADDGGEAEGRLAEGTFALILLDVMMPRLTGFQLLPIARRLQPDARIMVMSGYSDGDRGANVEPDAFLEKPFTAKQMDDAVDAVLAKNR